MTEEFVRSIEALGDADRSLLAETSEEFYDSLDAILDAMKAREPRSSEEDALPDAFLHGEFTSGAAVREYLDSIDPVWRLDAYLAVEDLLDEL
ncbi:hypothetical protein [Aeromicrobium endophyticum]|uniref:Uncharacterized protein n=1 Tax=Aeromicrobium endophyticum TaxID=2292704 RepID=A0A371P2G9_9ACTN|nr:hypothetical protein [Aeromicrobium endophyticum]REK70137.1 hypothetical protein DX116_13280 [Aeromicrobium endophyticum]